MFSSLINVMDINDVWVSTHDVINLMSYTMKGNVVDNMNQLMIEWRYYYEYMFSKY